MHALPLHAHIYGRLPFERALDDARPPTCRAMQSSADDLPRALRPWLPVRSFRHLPLLWRRLHRRARRMRLGTVQRRSNAPEIALARPRDARQCHVQWCMSCA